MAGATTAEAQSRKEFDFDKVESCRIHPGIGIARVGNSEEGVFIGLEAPCDPRSVTAPPGGFKDAEGRVKRQAARFRVFAYDANGMRLGELPISGRDDPAGAQKAQVEWTVHLANKKGAWYKFVSRFKFQDGVRAPRNPDIRVPEGQPPDVRRELVIDPGPRSITGRGHSGNNVFDSGCFRGTKVPLGELRADEAGRLLVLGGFGKSGSTKLDNPIGNDPEQRDFYANNDHWYDDVSDGPVTATISLPGGRVIRVENPEMAAWVIVAPPKYAPGIQPIVTLYETIREVALRKGWIADHANVQYHRDIYPILLRAADTAWVNDDARRGHGFDKGADFRNKKVDEKIKLDRDLLLSPFLASPTPPARTIFGTHSSAFRKRIFERLRNPCADDAEAAKQANHDFMPPLSGDDGDATSGEPKKWFSLLPSQYRKCKQWADGSFEEDDEQRFPRLEEMGLEAQEDALQRAALEPCTGGAFFPGIEMTYIANDERLYVGAFRINSREYAAGDITKWMALPWQADFYLCKDNWWPAQRPDDVVPEEVFKEVNALWRRAEKPIPVVEGLEGRVKWDRGLGVTTLFRRPWQNPASAACDDPHNTERRGCDDMVRYWSELGFVLPARTASGEVVHVERERRPYAGMDVRELFNALLNMDQHRGCLPKAKEYVESVLQAARQAQGLASAFNHFDNIRPFEYTEQAFEQRMKDIYDDCVDVAKPNGRPYDADNKEDNPYFRTPEQVQYRIRQLTPFNFLDGAWLRNVHRLGPMDEVNSILFAIFNEELGDGVPAQNHANVYRDLCRSFGYDPPAVASTAFARDPEFLDPAFESATFQLCISEFTNTYYPEIIGMTLWLEWTVLELHRIAAIAERVGLNGHFYRMHIAIDNAAHGHAAGIYRAVKLYLQHVRETGGERAVQEQWRRIWDGYVAFSYTFVILIKQIIQVVIRPPPSLKERLEALIRAKRVYGQHNHRAKTLGNKRIDNWFKEPAGFLCALQDAGYIVPGKPDQSRFFKLLEFTGPMYHVFSEPEIQLWRDWVLELGKGKAEAKEAESAQVLKHILADTEISRVRLPDLSPRLEVLRTVASDYRIGLWMQMGAQSWDAKAAKLALATKETSAQDLESYTELAVKAAEARYGAWLGWSMIRAIAQIAAEVPIEDTGPPLKDLTTGESRTIAAWAAEIRGASNPALPTRAFLAALIDELATPQDRSLDNVMRRLAPLAAGFDMIVPGNDCRRVQVTLREWLEQGCPLPEVAEGRVKPLRLDATLDEEEHHPVGIAAGFGAVH